MEASDIHLRDAGVFPTPPGDPALAGAGLLGERSDRAAAEAAALGLPLRRDQLVTGGRAANQLVSAIAKRAFDIVIACLILVVVAPLIAAIALGVILESPGPVFYRARRVGRGGSRLEVLKFRKMREGALGGPLTLTEDDRFTRVGEWLARTKLDELPQLLNVIRGEMSLIGPRPEDPRFVQRHANGFEAILQARPGITGLSQLAYRAESQILDPDDPIGDYEARVLPQKMQLDQLYVKRSNPLLDLRILVWTLATILLAIPVSVNRTSGRMTPRFGRGGRRRQSRPAVQIKETRESERAACHPARRGGTE